MRRPVEPPPQLTPKDRCLICNRRQSAAVPFAGAWCCQDCRSRAKAQHRSVAPVAPAPAVSAPVSAPPAPPLRIDHEGYVLNARTVTSRDGVGPSYVRTLVHEAGHAAAGFALGVPIDYLDPGPLGAHVAFRPGALTGLVAAKVTIAGYLAERMVRLPEGAPARGLSGKDFDDIRRVAADLGIAPDRVARWAGDLAPEVERILVDHAKGMDALCYRLLSCRWRRLDGASARAILRTGDPTVHVV